MLDQKIQEINEPKVDQVRKMMNFWFYDLEILEVNGNLQARVRMIIMKRWIYDVEI